MDTHIQNFTGYNLISSLATCLTIFRPPCFYVNTDMFRGSFTFYVTQCRWVGGLENVTLPIKLEKFYYVEVLLEVGGWSKYQKNSVT